MRVQKSICDIKHVNIGISKNKLEKWKIVDYFLMQPKLNSHVLECYIYKQNFDFSEHVKSLRILSIFLL